MGRFLFVLCNFFFSSQDIQTHHYSNYKLFYDASDFTHAQWSFLQGAFKPVSPFLMLPGQHFNQSEARRLWRNSCCHYFLISGRRWEGAGARVLGGIVYIHESKLGCSEGAKSLFPKSTTQEESHQWSLAIVCNSFRLLGATKLNITLVIRPTCVLTVM